MLINKFTMYDKKSKHLKRLTFINLESTNISAFLIHMENLTCFYDFMINYNESFIDKLESDHCFFAKCTQFYALHL